LFFYNSFGNRGTGWLNELGRWI